MRIKLTPTRVENLKAPETGELLAWDKTLPGFGVRVGRRRRTYILQYRFVGRSRRLKLGTFPALSLSAARAKAAEALARVERPWGVFSAPRPPSDRLSEPPGA